MSSEKSPSFQFYPRDFVGDFDVAALTLEQVGCYTLLLCYSWLKNGLPDDTRKIAKVLKISHGKFLRLWIVLGEKFEKSDDGRFKNPRQEEERMKQSSNRIVASIGGKASVSARKFRFGSSDPRINREPPCEPPREPNVNNPVHKPREPVGNLSSSSSISISSTGTEDVPNVVTSGGTAPAARPPGRPKTDDDGVAADVWELFRSRAAALRDATLPLSCRHQDFSSLIEFLARYPDPAKRAWLIEQYFTASHRPLVNSAPTIGQLCKWAAWLEAKTTAPTPEVGRTAGNRAAADKAKEIMRQMSTKSLDEGDDDVDTRRT